VIKHSESEKSIRARAIFSRENLPLLKKSEFLQRISEEELDNLH
jgi:hypothetical protein